MKGWIAYEYAVIKIITGKNSDDLKFHEKEISD